MKKLWRNQGLALLNWMISYFIVMTIMGIYIFIDPRFTLEIDNGISKSLWIELIQAVMLVILMFPIYRRLNKWMKIKL